MFSYRKGGGNRVLEAAFVPACCTVSLVAHSPAVSIAVTLLMCRFQLYLSSDHRTLLKSSKKSWLQEVTLTDENSHLNCWQATFLDPQLRLEYEGFPVRVSLACRPPGLGSVRGRAGAHTWPSGGGSLSLQPQEDSFFFFRL